MADAVNCEICEDGYYMSGDPALCTKCKNNCKCSNSDSKCTSCLDKYFYD